ncbi:MULTISPECIES: hypothetical protein [Arenibacter]|uniref:hypothetical protein n=1 Tax=Arenibacter TaxID=178469 RepID=UPI001300160A|nr:MULTISPECIES: hypothetical protein [Arenibacter]
MAIIIVDDIKSDTTIEFYYSDINTHFEGIIESVGLKGLLGKNEFSFFVSKGEGEN